MSTIQSIEQAVQQLPVHELSEFRQWFKKFEEAAWDSQIEADAGSGKLDALAADALTDYHNGMAREL